MPTVAVPSTLPIGVLDISVAKPRAIDNGHKAASRAVKPLEEGVIHLMAGLSLALGGTGFSLTTSGGTSSWTGKVRCPPYGSQIEAAVLVSLSGGGSTETLDVTLTTTYDATGETVTVNHQQDATDTATQLITLRADLGAGTAAGGALGQTVTLATARSAGGSGNTKILAISLRLVPQTEIVI